MKNKDGSTTTDLEETEKKQGNKVDFSPHTAFQAMVSHWGFSCSSRDKQLLCLVFSPFLHSNLGDCVDQLKELNLKKSSLQRKMVVLQLDWFPSPEGTGTVERIAWVRMGRKARCCKRNRNGCQSSACQSNEWTTKPWRIWLKFFSRSLFCIFALITVLLWLLFYRLPSCVWNLLIGGFVFSPCSFEHQQWQLEEQSWEVGRIPREGNKCWCCLHSTHLPGQKGT